MSPKLSKWLRRLFLGVAILLTVLIVIVAVGIHKLRAKPQWYQRTQLDPQQRDAAAQRALSKVADFHNQTAALHAAGVRARLNHSAKPSTTPTTSPSGEGITISFTDDELNALFNKWSVLDEARRAYGQFVEEPQVMLGDGALVLAGRVKEFNAIVSLHFEPRLDETGRIDLRLTKVLGGTLPLPEALLSGYTQKMEDQLGKHLPEWKRRAGFDSTGIANEPMINAVMAGLLLHTLRHEPAEPVLFLPIANQGSMPATLTEIRIDGATLSLSMRPLDQAGREQLLRSVRDSAP